MIKIKLYEKGSQKEKETTMKKVKDHLGNEYKSVSEMCRHYGINLNSYKNRIESGMSLEKSLTTPVREKHKKCKDHLGNEFNSVVEMCEHYEIDANLFRCRERLGWSLKDILETPRKVTDRRKEYEDSDGNKFKNKTELANFHNMSDVRYYRLMKSGYTLEDDENHKCYVRSCNVVTDPFGKTHRTLNNMLKYYDISKSSYFGYIVTGRTLKDLLIDKMNGRVQRFNKGVGQYSTMDHLGKVYESLSDMCRHYRIDIEALRTRLLSGWTLEKALTYPVKDVDTEARKSEDHLGNRYNSITSMCKSYGLGIDTYKYRIKKGWTVEKALTTPVRPKKKYNRD